MCINPTHSALWEYTCTGSAEHTVLCGECNISFERTNLEVVVNYAKTLSCCPFPIIIEVLIILWQSSSTADQALTTFIWHFTWEGGLSDWWLPFCKQIIIIPAFRHYLI